jgi:CRP-like cAMP-binding protein
MTELAGIETVLFLQNVDLFRFCSAEQILRLAAIARERSFAAGSPIFGLDEPARVLYCVVRGRVELTDGEGEIESIGPLGTFGVEEILGGRLRGRAASAANDTLTLAMEAEDFFDLLAHNIEIVKALFRRFLPTGNGASDLLNEGALNEGAG